MPSVGSILEASFGPGPAGVSISYEVPEVIELARFESLAAQVTAFGAVAPRIQLDLENKARQNRLVVTGSSVITAAAVNTVTFSPIGSEVAATAGLFAFMFPRVAVRGGDVFSLNFVGGGADDVFDFALLTLLIESMVVKRPTVASG